MRIIENKANEQAIAEVDQSTAIASRNSAIALIDEGNALEEQGKIGEAMARYDAAVQADSRCARAHLNRGNILAGAQFDEARRAYQLAITCDQYYAAAHYNLGNLNFRVGEFELALNNYQVAINIKPDFADAFVAMGNALEDFGRIAEAIESYQRALAICPNYPEVHFNLGLLAMKNGELTEAADHYKKAIDLGSTNPMASYMLAAWSGEDVGPMPGAAVASLFDDYASQFDTHLVGTLGYSIPKLMREAVGQLTRDERRFEHALDLGCGTGLIGGHFKDIVAEIDGVDLSPKMLEQASRKQIYSKLHCDEIVAWLERRATESLTFDIVLSADVFIYVGNLERAFKAAKRILADDGLFVFSVEHLAHGSFELLPTGRFAHSTSYVRDLASRHGFIIALSEQVNLRKERNVVIGGTIFVLTRP
jgi:predicted TPR repeat methyltransferase